jgi:hypothetical protein
VRAWEFVRLATRSVPLTWSVPLTCSAQALEDILLGGKHESALRAQHTDTCFEVSDIRFKQQ